MEKANEAVRYMVSVWDEVQRKWRESPDHVQQKFLEAEKELLSTPTNEGAKTAEGITEQDFINTGNCIYEECNKRTAKAHFKLAQQLATQQLAENVAEIEQLKHDYQLEKRISADYFQKLSQLKATKSELPTDEEIVKEASKISGRATEYNWQHKKFGFIKGAKWMRSKFPQSDGQRYGLSDRLFTLANDFAIAKEGDIAVRLHSIYNNYTPAQEPKGSEGEQGARLYKGKRIFP